MTSIIKIRRKREIVILTDGLGREPNGAAQTCGKCTMLPRAPALMASRGIPLMTNIAAAHCTTWSFDRLVAEGADVYRTIFQQYSAALPEVKQLAGREEVSLAGWSEVEQRFAIYLLVPDNRYESAGIKPFTFTEQQEPIGIAPGPLTEEQGAPLFDLDAEKFDLLVDGRRVMEMQQSWAPEYRAAIGVHVMCYRVNQSGVSASVVYRWPEDHEPTARA